ncbi:MAG TPA: hypothetical protein VGE98_02040, partial [Thermoanaerobaculia bacterium]
RGLWLLDPEARRATPLPHPPGTTLIGIDGLYFDRGRLVAVQNDVHPARLLAIALTPGGETVRALRVLLTRTPELTGPTTGAIVGDDFYFFANTPIEALSEEGKLTVPKAPLPAVAVRVLRLPPA